MSKEAVQDRINEINEFRSTLGEQCPEIARSFTGLTGSIMRDGAVKIKEKELIALGIAVGLRCVPCIYVHTKAALAQGASGKEVLEAASVAVLMSGGPGMAHVMEVMKALDAFDEKK